MKRFFIITFLCLSIGQVKSQTEEDALRSSQYGLFGTASYVGRAGAIGALGGDLTASSYNPAGLGLFYRSEFLISPSLHIGYSSSDYFGSKASDFRSSFYWAPVGLLLAVPTKANNDWKAFQVGFSYNRLAAFNNATSIYGRNPDYSITDEWVYNSNGLTPSNLDPFTAGLAFYTYLMDTLPGTGGKRYFSRAQGPSEQSQDFSEKGGIDEFALSISGNYNDFLYLGATLGIPYLSYERHSVYSEYLSDGNPSFDYFEDLYTKGWGVNLKIGAILRPTEWLRIGAAFHTPTFYSMYDDSYSSSLADYYEGIDAYSPVVVSEYYLITPFKVLGSVGATFGDQNSTLAGSIGVDYEYTNYSFMTYQLDDNRWENTVNDIIENVYKSGHVFRAGGSLNYKKAVFRAGYALFGSPYQNTTYAKSGTNAGNKNAFSAGLGYKSRFWYIDLAYAHTLQKVNYYMYDPYYQIEPVKVNKSENLIITTFGFRF